MITKKLARVAAVFGLGLGVMSANPAQAAELVVPGRSNIFAAGQTTLPSFPGGGGVLPPTYSFSAAPGQVLTFSSVTGAVFFANNIPPSAQPDGAPFLRGTNVSSLGGISGLRNDNAIAFLAGVFLSDDTPTTPAPPRLDFTGNTNFTEIAPLLNQTFFIGDGLTGTGTGTTQRFLVPENATRLVFGLVDAFNIQGPPSFYNDNSGAFVVRFDINSTAASVPEPTMILGFLAVAGLGIFAKRKVTV